MAGMDVRSVESTDRKAEKNVGRNCANVWLVRLEHTTRGSLPAVHFAIYDTILRKSCASLRHVVYSTAAIES